jgi:hypothetical protein
MALNFREMFYALKQICEDRMHIRLLHLLLETSALFEGTF